MHSIEAVMGEGIKAFPCIAKKCSHAYADTSAQRRHMDRCKFIAALITAEGLTPGFYRPFNHKAAKNQQGLVDDSDSFIDDGPDYDNVAQKDDSDDASVHYGDVADEDNLDRILFGSEEEEVDSMDDNDTILMEVPDSQEDSDSRSISP
jgi:Zn-dependent M28 family amino/carboxypeptidase